MPHVIIEYSSNVQSRVQATQLLEAVHNAMIETGVFSTPDIKSRAYLAEDFLVGGKGRQGSFIHTTIYLLEGRSTEKRQYVSETVLNVVKTLVPEAEQQSVDIRELMREVYRKKEVAAV